MRWTADLRRRRIWFQVHFVDGEDEVVAVGTEVERVITGHFEILIKDLLVIGEKGKACGKRRNQERQESNAESHGYRGQTVKDWWKQRKKIRSTSCSNVANKLFACICLNVPSDVGGYSHDGFIKRLERYCKVRKVINDQGA